jgi:hypothetical protein
MQGIEALRSIVRIQGCDGNWNFNPYMHGMLNGLELALAILEEREPNYREAPAEWLFDRPEPEPEPDNGEIELSKNSAFPSE